AHEIVCVGAEQHIAEIPEQEQGGHGENEAAQPIAEFGELRAGLYCDKIGGRRGLPAAVVEIRIGHAVSLSACPRGPTWSRELPPSGPDSVMPGPRNVMCVT